jgi:hypothetical protein
MRPDGSRPTAHCSVCQWRQAVDLGGGGVEVDASAGVAGLAAGFVHVIADGDEASVDRQGPSDRVEIVPAQAEQFVAAHPGEGQDPQASEQAAAGGSPQERLELLGGPCPLFGRLDGAEARGTGDEGDVAGDESSAGGVGERAAYDEVDLRKRSWGRARPIRHWD